MARRSFPGRQLSQGAIEHYLDPAYYTKTYARRVHDVEYYVQLAKRCRGAVLELGAGNGRVTLPIALAGVQITAVDHSAPMLADLRAQLRDEPAALRERVRIRRGDMRRVRLNSRFGLVIAPFNTVLHLYQRRDLEAFLETVQAHLAPGARLVFDFSAPYCPDLSLDPERWYGGPRLRHPSTGQLVRYAERFHYAPMTQILSIWMRFVPPEPAQAWEVLLTHRQYFPREMADLLHYNGFTDQRWTADFGPNPPSSHSQTLIVSCRPRAAKP